MIFKRSKRKDEIIKKWENKVSNLVSIVRERNAKITELENQISCDKSGIKIYKTR